MKKLSQNQITGQRGEFLVGDRTLAMGFSFDATNRLETGIDGFLQLRNPQTEETLALWIGAQVKTTESDACVREDDAGLEYLLKPDDLAYWRGANIPVIIVLVCLSDSSMYWKPVDAGVVGEPRRLQFDKIQDRFDKSAVDRVAALCIDRDRLGSHVPPMQSGEAVHLTMVRAILPAEVFVGSSLFASGRDATRELVGVDPHAPFDWVIRDRRFISFRDPRGTSLTEIVDEGSVEAVETALVGLTDDIDDEYMFIDLLGRSLSAQLDKELNYDRESRALYFRAQGQNYGRKYRYRSLVNETSAEVVSVWRAKDGHVGSVRHHAFVPRFQRIGDKWYLSITPTFIFTRDGFRPHHNAGALVAGKKKREKNGAVRGQFIMWRHLLIQSGEPAVNLLSKGAERTPLLRFESLEPVIMPLAVPEEALLQTLARSGGMRSGREGRAVSDFKGRHFEGEIVLWAVRWYCRYGVSYRDLEQMMGERGVSVDHSTIFRWVQRYAPEIEKRLRWHWRRPRSTSWRVDETYVKVRGRWAYLYRAVDKLGNTIDFCLSLTRSAKAAKRFLGKALNGLKDWEKPHVINTDKAPTYAVALAELKREGKCPKDTQHRQVKYLNNVVEADHGKLKQLIRPVRGFKGLKTAYATIKGSEVTRALRKNQAAIFNIAGDIRGEACLVEHTFGLGASALAEAVPFVSRRLPLETA